MTPEEFEQRMQARRERKAAAQEAQEAQRMADMIRLDDLEQQHGDEAIGYVPTPLGLVILRKPTQTEYETWKADTKKAKTPQGGAEVDMMFANKCLVHPPPDAYARIVEEFPGVPDKIVLLALRLAKAAADDEEGKL